MELIMDFLFKIVPRITFGYNKAMSKKILINGIPSRQHPLYNTWSKMMQRCNNPNCIDYKDYGGRGIKVYPKWHKSENFLRDMSPTYKKGLSIDRIDVNKGYYPSNCRWADSMTQNRNRRITKYIEVKGIRYHFADLAKMHGVTYDIIMMRYRRDRYSPEELLAGKRKIIREQDNFGRFTGKTGLSV